MNELPTDLPLWAALPATLLLLAGGVFTLIGSIGLLRLPIFFQRLHGPSMGATLGAACVLCASVLASSAIAQRPVVHEFLIALFLVMSAPVTSMMLVRAAFYRDQARKAGETGEEHA
jgi:multicomponent K+:H+ antiporter subunit G